jgi:molecular chaperone DnaK (HSP70)
VQIVRRNIFAANQFFKFVIDREEFLALASKSIDATIEETRRCLRDARVDPRNLDCVVIAGGSAMLPSVESKLRESTGADVLFATSHPDRAIAYGAALLAARAPTTTTVRSNAFGATRLAEFEVGIDVLDADGQSSVDILIKAGCHLPAYGRHRYYLARPDQRYVRLALSAIKRDGGQRVIGELNVGPIENPKLNYPIDLTATYGRDGQIALQVCDVTANHVWNEAFVISEEASVTARLMNERDQVCGIAINPA